MNEQHVQLNIQISQGSAATALRRGGRFYFNFYSSSFQNVTVKKLYLRKLLQKDCVGVFIVTHSVE